MKEEFKEIYELIINSSDTEKMHALGCVVKDLMLRTIDSNPQLARELLDKLQSVKWNNYVTQKEAESKIQQMKPKPTLTIQAFEAYLSANRFISSEEPIYNKWALYLTICMIYSDSQNTILTVFEEKGVKLDDASLFKVVYYLALDKLKDADKGFKIRKYFNL